MLYPHAFGGPVQTVGCILRHVSVSARVCYAVFGGRGMMGWDRKLLECSSSSTHGPSTASSTRLHDNNKKEGLTGCMQASTSRGVRPRVRALVVVEARGLRHRAGRGHPLDVRDLGHDGALVGPQLGGYESDRVLVGCCSVTRENDNNESGNDRKPRRGGPETTSEEAVGWWWSPCIYFAQFFALASCFLETFVPISIVENWPLLSAV